MAGERFMAIPLLSQTMSRRPERRAIVVTEFPRWPTVGAAVGFGSPV
jgi:hypothetical protein